MFTEAQWLHFAPLTAGDVVAWSEPPGGRPRLADDVHLWRLALDGADEVQLTELARALSDDERERAGRFHLEVHRRRYILGRGLMRAILARYLDISPSSLAFIYSQWGKPHLAGGAGPHFNLTHSEHLGLLAVRQIGPMGIDVERIDRPFNHTAFAAQHFSPGETEPEAFFRAWTRREAVLKATGLGIAGLNRELDACTVQTFVAAPGFIASVALLDPARRSEFTES